MSDGRALRDLSERLGEQAGVAVPAVEATVGIGSGGDSTPGTVYLADIENVRIQVVTENATALTVCKVQASGGSPTAADAQWVDVPGGNLGAIAGNDQNNAVMQGTGWRWFRLRAADGLGTASITIRWSGR